jgi:hypothetical protein
VGVFIRRLVSVKGARIDADPAPEGARLQIQIVLSLWLWPKRSQPEIPIEIFEKYSSESVDTKAAKCRIRSPL